MGGVPTVHPSIVQPNALQNTAPKIRASPQMYQLKDRLDIFYFDVQKIHKELNIVVIKYFLHKYIADGLHLFMNLDKIRCDFNTLPSF